MDNQFSACPSTHKNTPHRNKASECSLLGKFQHVLPVGLCAGVWLGGHATGAAGTAFAQVSGDRSFGTLVNGALSERCLASVCTIEGGVRNGSSTSLFHSFEEFSILSPDQSVVFSTPAVNTPAIDNILVRVTGGSASLINGLIRTGNGSEANLFLVNPAGISFGPTAQLDLGGSFLASTAQQLIFDTGAVIPTGEATSPTAELLSINLPIGLGFLSAPIEVQGPGNFLTFGAPNTPSAFVNRVFQPDSGLAVQAGESIKLVGNGIALSGGSLTATGGDIELGSLASGRVLFDADLKTNYAQVDEYADIALAARSVLEASAASPGQVLLRGQTISVTQSSAVLAETTSTLQPPLPPTTPPISPIASPPISPPVSPAANDANANGALPSGLIDIRATDTVRVSDFSLGPQAPPFHSYLSVDVAPGATGPGGTLAIAADNLQVESGGQLGANTFGQGDAGHLNLTVSETVSLRGGSVLGPSGLFTTADVLGSGQAGKLTLKTGSLLMDEGAQILANSFNQAAAGSVVIDATQQVNLTGTRALNTGGLGPSIVTPTLIQSGMDVASSGQGGGVTVEAGTVAIADGAKITTGTFGGGNAGPLTISADEITLSGFSPVEGPSGLFTTVSFGAAGNGGPLRLEAERLEVQNGAQVATSTAGEGRAGDLFINGEVVRLSGRTAQGRSGLFATAVADRGAGGNLVVEANALVVDDGAAVSVSNFLSSASSSLLDTGGRPILPGQGPAGNLQVSAEQITLRNQGLLSADTAAGNRGNIGLQTDSLTLRNGSRITTNATGTATGGDINIDATTAVVAVPAENSDITANAVFGGGGQVRISSRQVLGLTARPAPTAQSDITASSEFGIAGETRVETLESDVRPTIEPLPQQTEVPEVLQGCAPGSASSSRFVQSGQGGIGSSPYGVLNSRQSLADVSAPSTLATPPLEAASVQVPVEILGERSTGMSDKTPVETPVETPMEAQGWGLNDQGQVVLMAAIPDEPVGQCLS
ncbi:MAG: S-layer family protein [Cyanobacteria bacterium P01_A01_bin.116]